MYFLLIWNAANVNIFSTFSLFQEAVEFEVDPLSSMEYYYLNPTTGEITLKKSLLLGNQLSDVVSSLCFFLGTHK